MDFPMEVPGAQSPLGIEVSRPSLGSMVLYGNNGKRVKCFNLNTKENCSYLFHNCKNLTIPDGMTFDGCTNASYMFHKAENIILPGSVTFASLTNGTDMFYLCYETAIPDTIKFDKLTSMGMMFYSSSVNIPLEATFEKVTSVS